MVDVTKLGFSAKSIEKLQKIGHANLLVKMAEQEGHVVDEDKSAEHNLLNVFGQKRFMKQASMQTLSLGIAAFKKLEE